MAERLTHPKIRGWKYQNHPYQIKTWESGKEAISPQEHLLISILRVVLNSSSDAQMIDTLKKRGTKLVKIPLSNEDLKSSKKAIPAQAHTSI